MIILTRPLSFIIYSFALVYVLKRYKCIYQRRISFFNLALISMLKQNTNRGRRRDSAFTLKIYKTHNYFSPKKKFENRLINWFRFFSLVVYERYNVTSFDDQTLLVSITRFTSISAHFSYAVIGREITQKFAYSFCKSFHLFGKIIVYAVWTQDLKRTKSIDSIYKHK